MIYYSYLNSHGGSNTHVLEVFHNLNKYVDAKLLAPKDREKLDFPNLKYIPHFNVKYLKSISYELSLSLYLVHYFIKSRPQIVYLRQNSISFLPVILCKIFVIKVIVEINGLNYDELDILSNKKSIMSKVYDYLSLLSEKFNYNYCNKIISVTSQLKEELISTYKVQSDKIAVINNGANIDLFKPIDSQEAKIILNLDSSKNYICFVGSLFPWQGVEYLIHASPFILKSNPNIVFIVVGEGQMKETLLELADELNVIENFIFAGSVPYEKVPNYINASDICVVPKKPLKSGYSPLKLYEYMACSKPVVASRVLGFEILEEIDAGLLINPENSLEFSNALLKLLNDQYLRNKMGLQGYDYVKKYHSWDSVAKRILNVCENA